MLDVPIRDGQRRVAQLGLNQVQRTALVVQLDGVGAPQAVGVDPHGNADTTGQAGQQGRDVGRLARLAFQRVDKPSFGIDAQGRLIIEPLRDDHRSQLSKPPRWRRGRF